MSADQMRAGPAPAGERPAEGVTLPKAIDVLVVGAGHAGLAMSYFLTEGRS